MSDEGKNLFTRIKKNPVIYENVIGLLYGKEELSQDEASYLFSVALVFIKNFEDDTSKLFFIDFAYEIIATTCFKIKDFRALYDFSVNYGYFPIAKKIKKLELIDKVTLGHVLTDIAIDGYTKDEKVITQQQSYVFEQVLSDSSQFIGFVAPTSYGKSELIFSHIEKKSSSDIVGIIVPTKALIDQVYRDARREVTDRKIIIHDQNYDKEGDTRLLAIVTQERALRLLDEGLVFDSLYIDEAHEILNFDFRNGMSNRSLLLSRMIRIAMKKNSKLTIMYLTPVIKKLDNLKLVGQEGEISQNRISKDLKIWSINYLDLEGNQFKYNKFFNDFYSLGKDTRIHEYIHINSKRKNLHFLYRPIFIEKYAEELYTSIKVDEEVPKEIRELIAELAERIHPRFKLIKMLSKGICYLHGRMPLTIRNYLLKYIRESAFLQHFVANSVVLAGMNLPIDTLFYVSGFANKADLHNLIGRVNRLNEIFNEKNNDLGRIMIPIHFIEHERFPQNKNGGMKKKIESLRSGFDDKVKNPLLESATIDEGNKEMATEIRDTEAQLVANYDNKDFKSRLVSSGAQQLLNYKPAGLEKLRHRLENYSSITDGDDIIRLIKELFFDGFDEDDYKPQYNVKRLSRVETIKYYSQFIKEMGKIYNERIESMVRYWKTIKGKNSFTYVGSQFGEIPYSTDDYQDARNKVYVNLQEHLGDEDYLYNLAIIKLQIDEDFVSQEITLLMNTLLEFEIITQSQFDRFIFGTDDDDELNILKLGISRSLISKLKENNQLKNIYFDGFGNAKANSALRDYINSQRGFEKFELEQYF